MNLKRIIGGVVILGGVVMLFIANYIQNEIEAGTLKITKAEKSVGQANSLFSLSPATKELSKGAISGANKKIAAGKQEIAYYTKVAHDLQMGGFVLIGAGILVIVLGGHKKKK